MLIDEGSGRRRPALTGRDLYESIPGAPQASITHYQPYKIASHEVTFAHWQSLARAVDQAGRENEGVVVIHGTDTMEEAAFFLAETLSNPDAVILGALRPSGHLGEDGPRNLRDAAIAATQLTGQGVCVCMNRALMPAWSVVKRDTVAFDAFATRNASRIGTIHSGSVLLDSAPVTANWIGQLPEVPVSAEDIALLALAADPSVKQVQASLRGAQAVLVESLATGSIPMTIRREVLAAARSVPVVVTSRCFSGPVHDEDDYPHAWDDLFDAGVQIEDHLDTYKTRIRLALSLALGRVYEPFKTRFPHPE